MSIDSLQKLLNQTISRTSRSHDYILLQPVGLQKQLSILERLYDNPQESMLDKDKTLTAIMLLEREGVSALTLRDSRYIAWGLSVHYPSRHQKLIFNTHLCNQLIKHFEEIFMGSVNRAIWWALLFSYFGLDKLEKDKLPPSWLNLKSLLKNSFTRLYFETKPPRDWMVLLQKNPELLDESITKGLAKKILLNQESLSNIKDKLNIAPSSWFFSEVVAEQVQYACTFNDESFKEHIEKVLLLGREHPAYLSFILKHLLNRYSVSKMRQDIHESLKKIALETWGSPQFSDSASWSLVTSEAKSMVLQWFVRADLEAFFSLLQGDQNADKRRLRYWLRFVNQISYTRLVLGAKAYNSESPSFIKFKHDNKGRFSRLTGSTASNNAFIMKVGGYFVIEFSETGNACFIFKKLQYSLDKQEYHISSDLKYGLPIEKISHSLNWESKLDTVLMGLGIYPNSRF